jgi:hypothetical protein
MYLRNGFRRREWGIGPIGGRRDHNDVFPGSDFLRVSSVVFAFLLRLSMRGCAEHPWQWALAGMVLSLPMTWESALRHARRTLLVRSGAGARSLFYFSRVRGMPKTIPLAPVAALNAAVLFSSIERLHGRLNRNARTCLWVAASASTSVGDRLFSR